VIYRRKPTRLMAWKEDLGIEIEWLICLLPPDQKAACNRAVLAHLLQPPFTDSQIAVLHHRLTTWAEATARGKNPQLNSVKIRFYKIPE
jgi:hypothetical protein